MIALVAVAILAACSERPPPVNIRAFQTPGPSENGIGYLVVNLDWSFRPGVNVEGDQGAVLLLWQPPLAHPFGASEIEQFYSSVLPYSTKAQAPPSLTVDTIQTLNARGIMGNETGRVGIIIEKLQAGTYSALSISSHAVRARAGPPLASRDQAILQTLFSDRETLQSFLHLSKPRPINLEKLWVAKFTIHAGQRLRIVENFGSPEY